MGDLDKNVYRKEDSSPYDKIIISPIEKDKKEREPFGDLKNATRTQTFAALVAYFKKFLSAFKSKGRPLAFDLQRLIEHVAAFRQLLITLSREDQSHNPDFTQRLTELWHNLLEDCNSLSPTIEASSEIYAKIKFFITQVQNFPPDSDHPLGYYFLESAGKDWIPFPFMEILQNLHEEHTSSPIISVLHQWTTLLNEILLLSGSE